MAQLKDYIIVQPKSKIKAGDGLSEGEYKFFTSSNTQTKWLNQFQYDRPALIFGTGGMASVHYCDTPFSTSTDCIVMYAKGNINLEYIYCYLESHMYILENGFKGVGLKHISKDYILSISIPEIDSAQIENLVSNAKKIDNIISARKKQLTKLDELVKSRFIEMFGDPMTNPMGWTADVMKSVCTKITDGEHGSVSRVKSGYVFLNAKHIKKDGSIDWETATCVTEEIHRKIYARCNPQPGDILLTTTGTIGNIAIVPSVAEFSMDRGITLLKIDKKRMNTRFMAALLNFDCIQAFMNANIHASAIGHLFLNKVIQIPVITPPIKLQDQFAAFVEQIEKSKYEIWQSLEKLEILKKSLMQQYFG